ncbi:MAG: 2-amino-4-hydroxy-6-hydroxymethyldihydropteridine diphosphokinase [Bacteroidales bacterium]|nr:2-amino-4-hydroxy-6-hydroxymethyldihydropteridine diphosphokinase [Bacteroidales bacterium]MCB9012620.1 2-amino-4-hydroxy-6-hydroxymethyldihydropteridine diphosphokinase [Bacteroidales bacterium]
MKRVFLLTGSNLGDSRELLKEAITRISLLPLKIFQSSGIYQSKAWGYSSENYFFNQCIGLDTSLSSDILLKKLLEIEMEMGRIRGVEGYADRVIDIDILFYGSEIIHTTELVIPHPRLHLRRFALVPLKEIAPGFLHPELKKTISELLDSCPDGSIVELCHSNEI